MTSRFDMNSVDRFLSKHRPGKPRQDGFSVVLLSMMCAVVLMLLNPIAASTAQLDDLPAEVVINGVEFIHIPAGDFYKSGGIGPDGAPTEFQDEHFEGALQVYLDGYYIAKYEARARDLVAYLNRTETKYGDFQVDERNCTVRQNREGDYFAVKPAGDLPATHLSWIMAKEWAEWMGFRLPTEAEWEKAARGPDQRLYPWGDDPPDETYAGFRTQAECYTWPVDSFKKGRSFYGVFNMSGNVREYVDDWYSWESDNQLTQGVENPSPGENWSLGNQRHGDPSGPWKILKGGRWASHSKAIRIGSRVYYGKDKTFQCNGTRFALDEAVVRQHVAAGTAIIVRD